MLLGKWLKETKTTQRAFAARIGVTEPYLSQILRGRGRKRSPVWPSREVMIAIRRETSGQVTADDFLPPFVLKEAA